MKGSPIQRHLTLLRAYAANSVFWLVFAEQEIWDDIKNGFYGYMEFCL